MTSAVGRWCGVGLCSALLALIAGCDDKASGAKAQVAAHGCVGDEHCQPDQLCIFGLCSDTCAGTDDCEDGATCFDTGRGSACVRLQDNACVTSANCPGRMRCVAGRCLTKCEAGMGNDCLSGQTCSGGVCVAEGTAAAADPWTSADAGTATSDPDAGEGDAAIGVCPAGSVQCRGNAVVRCDELGMAETEGDCAFACRNGACTGSCTPDALRCDGQRRERCDSGGDWETLETCTNLCTSVACVATCDEGTRQCNGSSVMRCASGALIEEMACSSVCVDGACLGACAPGSRRCANGAASTCGVDGVWMPAVPCANACVEGACTGVCAPRSQRCAGASEYQACSELGQWGSNQSCNGRACSLGLCAGVCTPGSARCESATSLQTCDVTGQWSAVVACAGQTCVEGRCVGTCLSGSRRCDPSGVARVQTCSPLGVWQGDEICEGGLCTEGQCQAECAVESRRCAPNDARAYQLCLPAGRWSEPRACTDNQTCAGQGVCPAIPTCRAGMSPDWYSAASNGGNRSLADPRWRAEPMAEFASTFGQKSGGYLIVFDQAVQELSVSIRVTLGPNETPQPADYVYFGITPNQPGAPAGRRLVIPLVALASGEGPKVITGFQSAELAGTWRDDRAPQPWIHHASAWRGGANDELSWAVSFRVNLPAAQVDPSKPLRLVLAAHAEGATGDLTTPANAGSLIDRPAAWALAMLSATACVGRVSLQ